MSDYGNTASRLFSKATLRHLIHQTDHQLLEQAYELFSKDTEDKMFHHVVEDAYHYLSRSYRNEYYYQNTLLNKLILNKRSKDTVALAQVPVARSVADFILINGEAVVYEIKSDLDSFARLKDQINDYYKAYTKVSVVSSEKNYKRLENMLQESPVGIVTVTKRNTISRSMKKEPEACFDYLSYQSMFRQLRKHEYEAILKDHFHDLPTAPSGLYYRACFTQFQEIPIKLAYEKMLGQLRLRHEEIGEVLHQVPYELRSLIYFSRFTVKERELLEQFLSST